MSDDSFYTNTSISEKNKSKPTSILLNKAVLLILSSNFFGKSYVIDKSEIIIGRQEDCDFFINDPMISKQHCRISIDKENKFFIEDMGSKNSTFLNDKILTKKKHLIYADRIIIGNTIIRFYHEEKIN